MNNGIDSKYINLFFYSVFISFIAYAYTLCNFTLSIDSEQTFNSNSSMDLGRWGTNVVRYHIFGGIIPYFTLLLGIILLSITGVELSRLFKLKSPLNYIFCGLFLTFPQLSYQLIFTMQADAIALGFLLSVISIRVFIENCDFNNFLSLKSILYFILSALLLMFVISIYQALIILPIVVFIIIFFLSTFHENYLFKIEFKKTIYFGVLLIFSAILYLISVKILCPPMSDQGYLSSYVSGNSNNHLIDFYNLCVDNIRGDAYYGEKTFFFASLSLCILLIKFAFDKTLFFIRSICLFLILISPFLISFFITNGSNPPRIFVASSISFAFLIVYLMSLIKFEKWVVTFGFLLCLTNIYFITILFQSSYKIFSHDKEIAKKINFDIYTKYPDFDSSINYVYFYGCLPYEEHEKFRIPNSEIFGGSFFIWDNGSNNRLINFFKFNDIAYYKEIDNKNTYVKIKDSINTMPTWPKKGYIKLIDNVIVIKLGTEKGAKLAVE